MDFEINYDLSISRDMMDFDLDMSDFEFNEEECLEEYRSDIKLVTFIESLTDKKIDYLINEITLESKELKKLLSDKITKVKNEIINTVENITTNKVNKQEIESEINTTLEKIKVLEEKIVNTEGELNKTMDVVIKAKKEKDFKIDAIKQAKNDLENKIKLYEEWLGLKVKLEEQPTLDVYSVFFDRDQDPKKFIKVRMRQKKNNEFDWDLLEVGGYPDSFEELAHRLRQTGNILETLVYLKDYYDSATV